jgi:hypothetical protein
MKLEKLRTKLVESIEANGILADVTIKLSEKLDVLITKEMKRYGQA